MLPCQPFISQCALKRRARGDEKCNTVRYNRASSSKKESLKTHQDVLVDSFAASSNLFDLHVSKGSWGPLNLQGLSRFLICACRVRMRRRSSDELMETQLLQEFGIAGGGRPLPPGRPAEPHSPETRVALDSLYASMDDNTNRCASLSEKDFFLSP